MTEQREAQEAPVKASPIPVAQFEGEWVREMEGRLPAVTLAMDSGYARGTIIRMQVEVRVRNVRHEEIGSGVNKGELVRQHVFVLESAQMVAAFAPEDDRSTVGGSASANGIDSGQAEGLGIQIGRTSDHWGAAG